MKAGLVLPTETRRLMLRQGHSQQGERGKTQLVPVNLQSPYSPFGPGLSYSHMSIPHKATQSSASGKINWRKKHFVWGRGDSKSNELRATSMPIALSIE